MRRARPWVAPRKMPSSCHAAIPSTGAAAQKGRRRQGHLARFEVAHEHPNHGASAQRKQQGERDPEGEGEPRRHPDRSEHPGPVRQPHRLADFALSDKRKRIQHKRRYRDELQQHLVAGHRGFPQRGSRIHKPGKREQQSQRADHHVTVDPEQLYEPAPIPQITCSTQPIPNQPQSHAQREPLGNRGACADPGRPPPESRDKQGVEPCVSDVQHNLEGQQLSGPAHAEKPAVDGVPHERCRRSPDAGHEVGGGSGFCRLRGAEEPQRDVAKHREGDEEPQPKHQAEAQPAHEDRAPFGGVTLALGLGGEPGGGHAEKAEAPIQKRKRHRRNSDGGEVGLVAHPAHDRGVYDARGRNRDLRHDNGPGQRKNLAMGERWRSL